MSGDEALLLAGKLLAEQGQPTSGDGSYFYTFGQAQRAVVAALSRAAEPGVSQRLQDHMEQFHGVCLKASEWDAAALAALSPNSPEGEQIAENANCSAPERVEREGEEVSDGSCNCPVGEAHSKWCFFNPPAAPERVEYITGVSVSDEQPIEAAEVTVEQEAVDTLLRRLSNLIFQWNREQWKHDCLLIQRLSRLAAQSPEGMGK